ncbi:MAG TPA: hypothetical protein VK210_14200, partial [Terriglobia bacterium]|nr:hypothetical protein [Terriglobia bacterium]
FLLPCLVLLMITRDWNWRRPAAMAVTAGAVSAGVYVLLGISMHHVRDVSGFFAWTLHYGVSDTLPMWGRWEGNRIPQAMISAFRSIVPTPLMIDPRMLSIGTPHLWGRIAVDIAGVAMSVLLLGAVVALWGKRENIRLSLCFAAGYACFLPFIIWWDPGQPEWFVVPNILLAGFLAVSWSARLDNGFARALCLVCIVAIAGGNFFSTFRPRHSQIGPDRGVAACVAANTKSDDLLLVAEWGWPDYMEYFYKRVPFNLIDESIGYNGNGQELMDKAMRVIRDTQRKGASVFTPDPAEYSPDHLEWLAGQAGVRLSHLQALNAVPAFKCGDRLMKVLVALP